MDNPTRRSASRCVNLRWTPKGVGKDLVETSVAFVRAAAPPSIKGHNQNTKRVKEFL